MAHTTFSMAPTVLVASAPLISSATPVPSAAPGARPAPAGRGAFRTEPGRRFHPGRLRPRQDAHGPVRHRVRDRPRRDLAGAVLVTGLELGGHGVAPLWSAYALDSIEHSVGAAEETLGRHQDTPDALVGPLAVECIDPAADLLLDVEGFAERGPIAQRLLDGLVDGLVLSAGRGVRGGQDLVHSVRLDRPISVGETVGRYGQVGLNFGASYFASRAGHTAPAPPR